MAGAWAGAVVRRAAVWELPAKEESRLDRHWRRRLPQRLRAFVDFIAGYFARHADWDAAPARR